MPDFSVIKESGFNINRGPTIGMLIMSILSMLGSLTMLSTGVLLPYQWKKTYMEIIYYIAISNFLTALGSSVGTPKNHSSSCYFEGIVTNIFSLSSVFWCIIISSLLYYIVANGKSFPLNKWMHLFCWGFPVAVTLLPFTSTNYGGDDDAGGSWCFIKEDDRSGEWDKVMWFWFAYYLWIWLSIVFVLVIVSMILHKSRSIEKAESRKEVRAAIKKMVGYPIVIVLVWAVSTAFDTLGVMFPGQIFEGYHVMKFLSTVYPCGQGFYMTIVFFYVMSDVRKETLETLREIINTRQWKTKQQQNRRRASLFTGKVAVDDFSNRYRSESSYRSQAEVTIDESTSLGSSNRGDQKELTTTLTAGDMILEDIE